MEMIEIKNIVRKDVPIYYRRLYSGIAVMELLAKSVEFPIEFQIEQKPTGQSEINMTIPKDLDYPVIPMQKILKKYIGDLDSTGKLPV